MSYRSTTVGHPDMAEQDPHQRPLISAKALLHREGRVLLVKNDRYEWDLPGGKLQHGEDLEQCLERELREELGFSVGAVRVAGAFKHHFYDTIMVIVYDCECSEEFEVTLSDEHSAGGWFDVEQMQVMNVPENYKRVAAEVCAGVDPRHV